MNVYEIMTERIVALLEKGNVPWHRPWNASAGMPRNLVTRKPYRGINVFVLTASGYTSPYWLTYRQAAEQGGHVKKGEKGWMIVFWKMRQVAISAEPDPAADDDEGGTHTEVREATSARRRPVLRYYTVFNLEQTEGIPTPKPEGEPRVFKPIRECERIVKAMPLRPPITYGHPHAKYKPLDDKVEMPVRESFKQEEEYYSTLFHELGHSTGHPKRVGRRNLADLCPFGSTNYSREELVAEMTATFLCGTAGISNETVENSAAYIAGWRRALEDDPRAVVIAAAQAQKAADWILDRAATAAKPDQEAA